ncbi:MAG: DHHW family protein [Christensenellales bacterium]|jgi:hypothetical protein
MKSRLHEKIICIAFCMFLFCMLALFVFLPKETFSDTEKRYLEEPPSLSWDELISGKFASSAESYAADHIAGRDFFVGLNAYYDYYSNRQVTKDIYVSSSGRLVERPVVFDTDAIDKNMRYINQFSEQIGQPVEFMIVPSAGYIYSDELQGLYDPYLDDEIIQYAYAQTSAGIQTIDAAGAFLQDAGKQDLYYHTDHHWTSSGAYAAYSAYMRSIGREPLDKDAFDIETHDGFYGTTYSRSALWLDEPDAIELYRTDTHFTVSNADNDEVNDGVFYPNRLSDPDMYTAFLDGNHSLVRIQNHDENAQGKLLIIRDSYANCFGSIVANDYEEVVLIDLRYYKQGVAELCAAESFDQILIQYCIGNFMTDANFVWLQRSDA